MGWGGGNRRGVDVRTRGSGGEPSGPRWEAWMSERQKRFLLAPSGPEVQAAQPPLRGEITCELPEVCSSQNSGDTPVGAGRHWGVLMGGGGGDRSLHSGAVRTESFYVAGQAPVCSFICPALGPKEVVAWVRPVDCLGPCGSRRPRVLLRFWPWLGMAWKTPLSRGGCVWFC